MVIGWREKLRRLQNPAYRSTHRHFSMFIFIAKQSGLPNTDTAVSPPEISLVAKIACNDPRSSSWFHIRQDN